MKEIIEKAIEYTKNFFKDEFSGHGFDHTYRVYKTAVALAEKENADIFTVSLSALLHDIDDMKISPKTSENLDNARSFLESNGVENDISEKVVTIIKEISFKGTDTVTPTSIEGKCVQDADRLDAIGAIGIARAFAYGGNRNRKMYDENIPPQKNMDGESYRKSQSTTVNHFYEKLFLLKDMMNTESAKIIAKERNDFMQKFLDEFFAEWEGTV